MSAPHLPVLLNEVVEAVAPAPGRLLVDATFGAGGYSRAFLETGAAVRAFDRDPGAARFAEPLARTFPKTFSLTQRRFSELEAGLAEAGADACDGIAFDLGVSSMQLDEAERGFSFMRDGPLDMRMGGDGPSAADLVNTVEQMELSRLFWTLGEERAAGRIAKRIVLRRQERPFERTLDLAEVVEAAVGGRKGAPTHPATRVFQALRIAVNEELAELQAGLDAAERVLAPGGRLVVVTFHSLEDRIVKGYFAERAGKTPAGSRHRPPAARGPEPSFELLFNGARAPTEAEVAANPRARSAKLRAGVRTTAPAWRLAA
ncbi:MAG TPA: 16S rRNA (cytosine(1402)-N(4))-methyltransferase RsmH [Caulobacteraceae bacterium]|jgi:16S rRNA (cytosine1402-N4)-methyltransferase|nr:16S rRNA (cytosine(1402)-N(4))-methyltransferase RsmH [Caulobacteraceae bacterium]